MTTADRTARLDIIANALNGARHFTNGYNHFEHFEELCAEQGLAVHYGRQELLDAAAAWSLYAWDDESESSCGLIVSRDRWTVDE